MPASAAPLQALVVDDHDIVRIGVCHLLAPRAQVAQAATLEQARAWLAANRCDLMLLDLGLGDDFSLTALPALRQSYPDLKIIVLTSMAEELYAERALRAGADGYLMKSALGQTLLEAVERVMSGQVYLSSDLGSALLRRLTGQSNAAPRPELSTREIEVLRLVGAGKTTREIALTLNRSVKTIESHKQALKTKLGADNPAALVRMAVAWTADAP